MTQFFLRRSPTVPLPLRTSALPSAVRPPCALRHPRKPITSSIRQLQSSTTHFELLPNPSNVKQHRFPTESLGLVDFVGFDGEGYLPHLPRSMRRDRANWREHDFKAEERAKETMKHPAFQPQVRVVNEVAQPHSAAERPGPKARADKVALGFGVRGAEAGVAGTWRAKYDGYIPRADVPLGAAEASGAAVNFNERPSCVK